MKVEAANTQYSHFQLQNQMRHQHAINQSAAEEAENPEVTASPITPETDASEVQSSEKEKGVIRLLEEGHFKGVADVRLRINFHEELAAQEQQQVKNVAGEKVEGVLQSVETGLTDLLEAEEITQEQYDQAWSAFEQAVNESKTNFQNSQNADQQPLLDEINSAFTALLETLSPPVTEEQESDPVVPATIEPQSDEPEITEEVEVPAETETPKPATTEEQDPFASLRLAFQTALDELAGGMNETQLLPPLSEPTGNGVAYEKFLAIYNQLQGIETTSDEGEQIDTTA